MCQAEGLFDSVEVSDPLTEILESVEAKERENVKTAFF
jgi:hypothetical protein